eukprot:4920488-Pyramimonas_sp.AAC.1
MLRNCLLLVRPRTTGDETTKKTRPGVTKKRQFWRKRRAGRVVVAARFVLTTDLGGVRLSNSPGVERLDKGLTVVSRLIKRPVRTGCGHA